MKKWVGYLMLFMTAFIWGTAFVAQSVGMNHVGPFTFNFSRYFVGAIVLAPVAIIRLSRKKTQIFTESKDQTEKEKDYSNYLKFTFLGGLGCGILLCVASSLQQFGILYTNAVGKSGFLTALYIILVPILGIFFGKKTKLLIWICVALATAGLYLLCVKEGVIFEIGDIFLILCALVFSFHILLIDFVSPKGDGVTISCMQFAVSAVICLICALFTE